MSRDVIILLFYMGKVLTRCVMEIIFIGQEHDHEDH